METRSPHWRAVLTPVLFALACVTLMIVAWVAFGGSVPFEPDGYQFTLPLPAATNVYPDTSVRIAGITVGKVIWVSRSGRDRARVVIQMDDQYAPIHTGATAIVRSKTLLGEAYIEMAPGPSSDPTVPDGGSLKAANVTPTQQLTDVLSTFDPATRARIRSMFAGLAAAGDGRSENISDELGNAGPTASSLATIATTLNGQAPSLEQFIADSGVVLGALGDRAGVIRSAVDAGDTVLAVTAQRNVALEQTIDALPPFLTAAHTASLTLGTATPDIAAAVGALDTATPDLVPALQALDTATPVLRRFFLALPPALRAGERDLPALERILPAATPALAQVYMAMRNLIPLIQLTAAVKTSVVGSVANVGSIDNGVISIPGLGLSHYASGTITIWNETIGGWVKRLPTNRANPYPDPTALSEMAHGGLRSYDCRNIHNILYVPPTGTGAPPCITQGPWTFDGRTAYYPRLQLAPP